MRNPSEGKGYPRRELDTMQAQIAALAAQLPVPHATTSVYGTVQQSAIVANASLIDTSVTATLVNILTLFANLRTDINAALNVLNAKLSADRASGQQAT